MRPEDLQPPVTAPASAEPAEAEPEPAARWDRDDAPPAAAPAPARLFDGEAAATACAGGGRARGVAAACRGLFVTGTGTGVGKTVVAAAILAALRARGERVVAFKPVVSGTDDRSDPDWPADDELLAAAAGDAPSERLAGASSARPYPPTSRPRSPARRSIRRRCAPRSPAARLRPSQSSSRASAGCSSRSRRTISCATSPVDLGLPLVVAASPGLGTINHTLLTLVAARSASLTVAGVVMTPWPDAPTAMQEDNRATIARLGEVDVAVLPILPRADPALLAAAGAQLPLDRWLAAG